MTPAALGALLQDLSPIAPTAAKARSVAPADPVLAEDLSRAIADGELVVYYQPQVDIATRTLVGAECLVRWRHPIRGLIPPAAFVPVAETCGLINAITDAVVGAALPQGGAWRAAGRPVRLAINLSVDSFDRYDLPETLMTATTAAGLTPGHIVIEVTESRLMADIRRALEVLTRLRLKGFALSIDDFGTGHSSLEQLKRIPFTELKIDRSFVCEAARDPAARAIVESSISLAHALEMTTVAEGVETQDDWDLMAALGVDVIQGYFLARPLAADAFDAWCVDWATRPH